MSDRDVQALKEFRAGMTEVDGAEARVRHRIARTIDAPQRRGTVRRWAPALTGALAAGGVLIGTIVMLQPGQGTHQVAAGPTVKPSASTSASPHVEVRVNLPRAEPGPLTAQGLTVGADQLLYIRSRSSGNQHEMWAEPAGMIVISLQREDEGKITIGINEAGMADEVAQNRKDFADNGPGIALPTQQYLTTLPTNPVALREALKAGLHSTRDGVVLKDTTDWLYRVEPILTPAVRTAVIHAMETLPNVKVDHSPKTFHGRPVYVVEQKDSTGTAGLIVDQATSRIVGSYAAGKGHDAWATATLWEYAVVNR
jgi:hypothetical protein